METHLITKDTAILSRESPEAHGLDVEELEEI